MLNRTAFTMIELIFVIVILGVLASVALPKFGDSGKQARLASGKADVQAIRSAILSERQKRLITGDKYYISPSALNNGGLFKGVLKYAKEDVDEGAGKWHKTSENNDTAVYDYNIDGVNVQFTYTKADGTFTCTPGTTTQAEKYCKQMIY